MKITASVSYAITAVNSFMSKCCQSDPLGSPPSRLRYHPQ